MYIKYKSILKIVKIVKGKKSIIATRKIKINLTKIYSIKITKYCLKRLLKEN
jgi:hypothetical protein